jgi:protein BUR2
MPPDSQSSAPTGQLRDLGIFENSKDPIDVLAEAELQWIYTEEELLRSPSIVAGMPPTDEKQFRSKGVNFIIQVGIMLKLPQTTVSTASVFFNRFLMRYSLVNTNEVKVLHHYVSSNLPCV